MLGLGRVYSRVLMITTSALILGSLCFFVGLGF